MLEYAGDEAPGRVDFTNPIGDGPLPEVAGREEVRFEKSHPLVPQLPCMWNLVGPSGVGKTTLLVRLLLTAWRGKFDKIIVFNPLFKKDKNWALIHIPEDRIFTTWTEQHIQKLHDQLNDNAKQCIERGERVPAVLVVLDDSAGLQKSKPGLNPVDVMSALDRKINVSVVNLGQTYKGIIGKTSRYNATHTSVFKLQSREELGVVMKELCPPDIPYKQFVKMYLDSTGEKLGDFFHTSRFSPVGARFSANFHRVYAL